jgi:hypothetical protein
MSLRRGSLRKFIFEFDLGRCDTRLFGLLKVKKKYLRFSFFDDSLSGAFIFVYEKIMRFILGFVHFKYKNQYNCE